MKEVNTQKEDNIKTEKDYTDRELIEIIKPYFEEVEKNLDEIIKIK